MDCTIRVAKTKALISFAVTAKPICVFVFAYAKRWFSHDAAHISPLFPVNSNFLGWFGSMPYVHRQQLRSCWDGPHCSWASLPEACNQCLAHILSPLTDNCSS